MVPFLVNLVNVYSTSILATLEHLGIRGLPAADLLVAVKCWGSVRLFIDEGDIRQVTLVVSEDVLPRLGRSVDSSFLVEIFDLLQHFFHVVTVRFVV